MQFGREVYPERNNVESKEAQEEEQREKCCFARNGTFLFPSILALTLTLIYEILFFSLDAQVTD
jgi:hypothetical protein